jgi:transcriptional regulator with XRE-family HTH domain
MTLQELLQRHGIHSMPELRQRTGLSKAYAWRLWHGKVNIGWTLASRLADALGIPLDDFRHVHRPVPPKGPMGRPRNPPPMRAQDC